MHRGGFGGLGAGVPVTVGPTVSSQCLQGTAQHFLVILRKTVEVRGEESARAAMDDMDPIGSFELNGLLMPETKAPLAWTSLLLLIIIQIILDQLEETQVEISTSQFPSLLLQKI